MKYNFIKSNTIVFIFLFLAGCSGVGNTSSNTSVMESQGTLSLVANGEDFVRKGFTTKDGWQINFERVEVTLGEVTAYQVAGGFNPEKKSLIKSHKSIQLLSDSKTIDLAKGGESAKSILVKATQVPAGFYNALSWNMLPKMDSAFADGRTILLEGTAIKGDRRLNLLLGFNQPLKYLCGEFIGDSRKGMVKTSENTELEMTFHFDHIFGDQTVGAEAEINQKALGFEPLANLASSDRGRRSLASPASERVPWARQPRQGRSSFARQGTSDNLKLGQQDLSQKLSLEAYQKLENAIAGIGHVGEGHCSIVK